MQPADHATSAPSSSAEAFRLTLLTKDCELAARADEAGVARIGIDLETLGKAERQAGHDTRLSRHRWEDLEAICGTLRRADAFVRLNPLHDGTAAEVGRALAIGAKVIMLPYFSTGGAVKAFVDLVAGRALTIALVETMAALFRLRDIVERCAVSEIMIGLNDLRLQAGLSPFEILASPILDCAASEIRRSGIPISIGGVARPDDGSLPVHPELVFAQYARLGSSGAWLSRSFFENFPSDLPLSTAVSAIEARMAFWKNATREDLEAARETMRRQVRHDPG